MNKRERVQLAHILIRREMCGQKETNGKSIARLLQFHEEFLVESLMSEGSIARKYKSDFSNLKFGKKVNISRVLSLAEYFYRIQKFNIAIDRRKLGQILHF